MSLHKPKAFDEYHRYKNNKMGGSALNKCTYLWQPCTYLSELPDTYPIFYVI